MNTSIRPRASELMDQELANHYKKAVEFSYTNWRGEIGTRRIIPGRIYHGKTEWHPEPQWLLRGFDLDKRAVRDFALKDIEGWCDLPIPDGN